MIMPRAVDKDVPEASDHQHFEEFVSAIEPQLRRSLVAIYGADRGREAAAEALAWAWEHWDRVQTMDHPLRYLFRVGQSRTRRRRQPVVFDSGVSPAPAIPDPALATALTSLTERQRAVVVLVHGFGYSQVEVATLLGIRPTSVQNHLERGLHRLRTQLKDR